MLRWSATRTPSSSDYLCSPIARREGSSHVEFGTEIQTGYSRSASCELPESGCHAFRAANQQNTQQDWSTLLCFSLPRLLSAGLYVQLIMAASKGPRSWRNTMPRASKAAQSCSVPGAHRVHNESSRPAYLRVGTRKHDLVHALTASQAAHTVDIQSDSRTT